MKHIYIITGGTMVHVTPHFSLCAPAYGKVGSEIFDGITAVLKNQNLQDAYQVSLIKTKMAGVDGQIETNDDLEDFVRTIAAQPQTAVIIMAAAICDFVPEKLTGFAGDTTVAISQFGKDKQRLHQAHSLNLKLRPSNKIIDLIKTSRPDICLVTFKTTAGATEAELIEKSYTNLQRSHSDFVFGNDIHKRINIVILPDRQLIHGQTRQETLELFCQELIRKIQPT